jgi:putative ABC transport system substrate-binding protein
MRFYRLKRREFITLLGGMAASASSGFAQAPSRRALIAYLAGGSKAATERYRSGFPQGMRELGYLEGRDYVFEDRYADGDLGRLPSLAAELVELNPDVILPGAMVVVVAVKKLTDTIPIVSEALFDPIGFGMAASHARPGGNVTGVPDTLDTLLGKQVELALEMMSGARILGMLLNANNPASAPFRHHALIAVRERAAKLVTIEVRLPADLDFAFQAMARERIDFLMVSADAMLLSERRRIAALAREARLPTIFERREHVEDGGLLSYGVNLRENWRRVASYVDKILKGSKAGDLSIEFPTKLELVINLKTAKALGLEVPPMLLARADEVIE